MASVEGITYHVSNQDLADSMKRFIKAISATMHKRLLQDIEEMQPQNALENLHRSMYDKT